MELQAKNKTVTVSKTDVRRRQRMGMRSRAGRGSAGSRGSRGGGGGGGSGGYGGGSGGGGGLGSAGSVVRPTSIPGSSSEPPYGPRSVYF